MRPQERHFEGVHFTALADAAGYMTESSLADAAGYLEKSFLVDAAGYLAELPLAV